MAGQAEVVSRLLAADGRTVVATSPRLNPVIRTADMVGSVFRWRRRVDVVVLHVFSGRAFLTADVVSAAVTTLRLPLVMVLRGGGLPAFRRRHPTWVERVLRRATHLVAPSPFLARELGDIGVPLTVVPNVIALGDYDFRERAELRPRLLWMRAFSDIYRPALAIETFAEVRRWLADATLTMAGQPGPLLEPTRRLATALGVDDAVEFVGFLDAGGKRRAFAAHDVFLVTTRVDNTPVSVVEAAASGLPIVACDVGGIADLLEDGRTGLLVDDPTRLPDAVRRLLDDRALAGRLSREGRVMAEAFDWPAVRARWDALYDQVLAGRPS